MKRRETLGRGDNEGIGEMGAMSICANLGRDRKSSLLPTELPRKWAGVVEIGWKLAGAAVNGD